MYHHWLSSLLILLLTSFQSHAISIIGNRYVEDQTQGFRFPLVGEFSKFSTVKSTLQMTTRYAQVNPYKGNFISVPVEIDVRPRDLSYPQWAQLSREDLGRELQGYGWKYLRIENSCVDVYFIANEQTFNYFLAWGPEKGFVMTAPALSVVQKQMHEMILRTELLEGACSWK